MSSLAPDVTILVHTPEPAAGAGQYVAEFVKSMAASHPRVKLFCPANFEYAAEVSAAGARIVAAPARDVRHAPFTRRVLRNLSFILGSMGKFSSSFGRGDIVHFQFPLHLFLGLIFVLIARLKGAYVVLTVHDPLPHRWFFPRFLRWAEALSLWFEYALCHRLIVHNQAGRRTLMRRFRVAGRFIRVIPHGPLNPLRQACAPGESPSPAMLRLLIFGSLRENKGIHLAIAAVQSLRRGGEAAVGLTIAGHLANVNELPYWESCKRLMAAAPDGIEIWERVWPDEELPGLFAAHDAVLLPYTSFQSESGVAMLALSQQKPLVATAAGGLGELLREAVCGISIQAATVEAVSAAIREAAFIPRALLKEKGRRGYEYAVSRRSWSHIAAETLKLYRGLRLPHPKIVLHTPEAASSASLYVEALAQSLSAQGIGVAVVCPANLQAIPALHAAAIPVCACAARGIRSGVSFLGKISQNAWFIVSSAAMLLRTAKPGDVVHLQYILHLPFGLVFFACAWLRRAKLVFTVHDPLPHKFLFPPVIRPLEMAGLRWAYQWSGTLIVHSEAGRQKLIDAFGIAAEKIRVIVHGPYPLRREVCPCGEKSRLEVLFFGSLRENKAPHLAIQAAQRLHSEGIPIRLTIAGQVVNRKEERYWAQCKRLIDPTSPAIRLIDRFIPDDDLPELFSSVHCFVLPYTRFSSDSGVAYMALANRKPILSTAAGGLGWLLENSGGGISISAGAVESVAAALRTAAALGPDELERLGRRGAAWVMENCGWPVVARETGKVYRQYLPELADMSATEGSRGSSDAAAVEVAG